MLVGEFCEGVVEVIDGRAGGEFGDFDVGPRDAERPAGVEGFEGGFFGGETGGEPFGGVWRLERVFGFGFGEDSGEETVALFVEDSGDPWDVDDVDGVGDEGHVEMLAGRASGSR